MTQNVIALAALLLSAITAYVTLAPIRNELNVCKKERTELRRRLEIVTAAIIGTLPHDQRVNLLAELDERIRPIDSDHLEAA